MMDPLTLFQEKLWSLLAGDWEGCKCTQTGVNAPRGGGHLLGSAPLPSYPPAQPVADAGQGGEAHMCIRSKITPFVAPPGARGRTLSPDVRVPLLVAIHEARVDVVSQLRGRKACTA